MLNGGDHCAACGEEIEDVNVEAFEISGKLLCEACADRLFEDEAERDADP